MNIKILLPLKENFAKEYPGAVSLFVRNTLNSSKYKNQIKVIGNTKYKDIFFGDNYINLNYRKSLIQSENESYVDHFIKLEKKYSSDIIEIHNRPAYINKISKVNKNIVLYFHNDALTMKGSKSLKDRKFLLNNTKHIVFISKWLCKRFFNDFKDNEINKQKYSIINHSINKKKINLNKKKNIIIFVGRLNKSKGYDLFGKSIIKVLDKYKNWSARVYGDEPRENLYFNHLRLHKFGFRPHEEILKEYEISKIAIVCSRWDEPFGRTALEATSRGCATVITNKGGLHEASCGSGIFLNKLDEKSLINVISKLIDDKKRLISHQNKALKSFNLTNEIITRKIDILRDSFYFLKKIIFNHQRLKIINVYNIGQKLNHRLYNLSIGKKFTNGFIRNNHDVLEISERDFIKKRNFFNLRSKTKLFERYFLETIKNYNPDIICFGHAESMNRNLLLKTKEINNNIILAHWNEDPMMKGLEDSINNLNKISSVNDIVDHSFITTHESVLKKRNNKLKNLSFFFPPVDANIERYSIFNYKTSNDLFYAMSHGVNRAILKKGKIENRVIFLEKLISKIKDIKYDFYGYNQIEPVWGENFYKSLINCSMGLNLSRGEPTKYYSSNRIATLIGNGQLTFIDKKTMIGDFFSDNEIITYDTISDLASKIIFYKKNPSLLKKFAKNGKKKYFKLFNEKRVASYIISKLLGKNLSIF